MAQKLFIKDRDENGKESLREVHIIRSWQDADGRQVFLHQNGVYGYKDGSPVRSERDFDIIAAPIQKKLAMHWWRTVGSRMSLEFYEDRARIEEERQADNVPVIPGDLGALDAVLYRRRTIKGKRAFGDPKTWYAWFQERPDWWGYAGMIEIGSHRYEQVSLDEAEPENPPVEDEPAETEEAVNF